MNIAVYVPLLAKSPKSDFIVETFFPLFGYLKGHQVFLITDVSNLLSAFQVVTIRPQPGNLLLKKLWTETTLTSQLRKIEADIFISADNFCSNASLHQLILLPDPRKMKLSSARKAKALLVLSQRSKEELINRLSIRENKILVIYPSFSKVYSSADPDKKESIRNKYSEGKEFFLNNINFEKQEDLLNLLRSFSHFKKRQQSSFKLLLLADTDFTISKSIENYKYRNDVILVRPTNVEERAVITSAAYAAVLPYGADEDMVAALNAMRAGVPVITVKNSPINEMAGEVVLYAENEIKDIGEKMMQLYKDEGLRSQLVEKGKELAKNFTEERSASQLWQTITEAMN